MVLQRWTPISGFRRTDDIVDRFWKGFGVGPTLRNGGGASRIPLDVVQSNDDVVVRASVPGAAPEDIGVDIEDGVLTVSTETTSESEQKEEEETYLLRERRSGSYRRSLRLPDSVDADKAESSYEHGVVTITFPKVEAKKAKRIEIKAK